MDRQDVANPQGGERSEAEIEKLGNWWLPKLGCRLEVKGRWLEKVNENEELAPQDPENDITAMAPQTRKMVMPPPRKTL